MDLIKKEMNKKHLITCSVMAVLVIISTLNICSVPVSKIDAEIANKTAAKPAVSVFTTPRFVLKNTIAADEYSFADETLPVKDAGVKRRLERSLQKHGYRNVGSNILHVKALKWFPIIEPILKAYGIPDDFKYVPLVESGFGESVSSKGARGLWQFMPGTARTYGLKVHGDIDERTNMRKSTIAACRYIRALYSDFNSWTLAAAAYNNGEIKLEHAINNQSEDNYFLMHLNSETAAYVYNLVAMKQIISQPERYGYKPYLKPAELFAFN
jgi:membrane-bound lytic murein transglycosylase D